MGWELVLAFGAQLLFGEGTAIQKHLPQLETGPIRSNGFQNITTLRVEDYLLMSQPVSHP